MRNGPTSVYRMYDAAGVLLYVGMSADVGERMGAHESKRWWTRVASVRIAHYPTRARAAEVEADAIALECPEYNVHLQDKVWRGDDSEAVRIVPGELGIAAAAASASRRSKARTMTKEPTS
jgi:predicted GIY-YIG superfamily endonuclease